MGTYRTRSTVELRVDRIGVRCRRLVTLANRLG
jgi:hypothetical protein